jgi:hypothetical protein
MSEVDHAEAFQKADLAGQLGQVVVRQDQCLNFRLLPHRIWYLAEMFLPQIEIRCGGSWHGAYLMAALPYWRGCVSGADFAKNSIAIHL